MSFHVIESLSGYVGENLGLLAQVEEAWQPSDFLPDLTAEDWVEQVTRFRESASSLTNDILVILVGNMVTEEALPNYAISLNQIVKDTKGDRERPLGSLVAWMDSGGKPPRRFA